MMHPKPYLLAGAAVVLVVWLLVFAYKRRKWATGPAVLPPDGPTNWTAHGARTTDEFALFALAMMFGWLLVAGLIGSAFAGLLGTLPLAIAHMIRGKRRLRLAKEHSAAYFDRRVTDWEAREPHPND
jgi:hypothetical protein